MDANIIVPLLTEKLQNLLNHEPTIISSSQLRNVIQSAINQLNFFQRSLQCVEENETLGHPMRDQWLARLLNTVYTAEDAIDTFLTRTALHRQRQAQRRSQTRRQSGFSWELCRPFTSLRSLNDLFANEILQMQSLFAKEIKTLMTGLRELSSHENLAKIEGASLDVPGSSSFQNECHAKLQKIWDRISGSSLDQNLDVVGLDEQVKEMVAQLTPKGKEDAFTDGDVSAKVIALVGDAGSGKTTLARIIYNRPDIKRHFERHSWVCFSKDSKVEDFMLEILKQLDENVEEEPLLLESATMQRLKNILAESKTFIVLDDVGTPEVLKKIGDVISTRKFCRVIVTTRDPKVAQHAASEYMSIQLLPLSNEDSWDLFLKKLCLPEDSSKFSKVVNLKDQILEICQGLPLSIVLMGGLLSTKTLSEQVWSRVIEQADASGNILALSYHDLPSNIKPCFLYMGLFPKAFDIPIRRLFQLWIVEGFVRMPPSCSSDMVPEDLAEKYLKELVCRNIIEIGRWRPDGSPKTCYMPRVLHDMLSRKAMDIDFFYILRNSAEQQKFAVRRFVAYSGINNYPSSKLYLEHLHSFVSFNPQNRGTQFVRVEMLLNKVVLKSNFRLLRVLDLESVYKPKLPEALGEVFRFLIYLGLRSTALDSLPGSVGELLNLETLDVKHTFIATLPGSICEAKSLRHLYMNWAHLDTSNPELSIRSLTKLQTLWGLSISKDGHKVTDIMELTNIRKLGLTYNSSEAIGDMISRLTKLQSLMLRSTDGHNKPSEIKLSTLEKHNKLSNLYLLGRLPSMNTMFFPPNLKILTLSMSGLEEDPMPMLGQLPHLIILRLFADSYLGEQMTCRGGFPRLLVLKMWELRRLEKWILEDGALPCLRELEIRGMAWDSGFHGPKQFYEALHQLTSLRQLTLTGVGYSLRTKGLFVQDNKWESSRMV